MAKAPSRLRAYRIYEDPNALTDTFTDTGRGIPTIASFCQRLDLLDIIYYVSGLWWEVPRAGSIILRKADEA